MRKLPVISVAAGYFRRGSMWVAVRVTPGSGVPGGFLPLLSAAVAAVTTPVTMPPCTSCAAAAGAAGGVAGEVVCGAVCGVSAVGDCACTDAAPIRGSAKERQCSVWRPRKRKLLWQHPASSCVDATDVDSSPLVSVGAHTSHGKVKKAAPLQPFSEKKLIWPLRNPADEEQYSVRPAPRPRKCRRGVLRCVSHAVRFCSSRS